MMNDRTVKYYDQPINILVEIEIQTVNTNENWLIESGDY